MGRFKSSDRRNGDARSASKIILLYPQQCARRADLLRRNHELMISSDGISRSIGRRPRRKWRRCRPLRSIHDRLRPREGDHRQSSPPEITENRLWIQQPPASPQREVKSRRVDDPSRRGRHLELEDGPRRREDRHAFLRPLVRAIAHRPGCELGIGSGQCPGHPRNHCKAFVTDQSPGPLLGSA